MPETQFELLGDQKSRIVNILIICIAVALVPISVLVVIFAFQNGWGYAEPLQLVAFGFIWLLVVNRKFLGTQQRATVIMAFLFIAAMSEPFRYGLLAATFPMLAILPILATVVSGIRAGFIGIAIVTAALVGVAWYTVANAIAPSMLSPAILIAPEQWAVLIVNVAVASGLGVFMTGSLHRFDQATKIALRNENAELLRFQSRISQSAKLAGLGYALTDQISGRILECDEAYARMHGLTVDEITSLDITDGIIGGLIHEDDRVVGLEVRERVLAGEGLISELRHVWPNGEIRFLRKIFAPLNPSTPLDGIYEIISQDVTEARQLTEQLFQSRKMDAVGKLTGGVAHDFNNLLAVILGNLELLDDVHDEAERKEMIQAAIDATLRGSELTRNMLSFARRAPLEPTVVDLNQLVRNMKNWIGRTLPSTIEVETSLLAGLWQTEVDASSAESGLLNLILNAQDAMPYGGKLTIETSNVRIDDEYLDMRGEEIEPGRYVMLAVSDTGEGIPAADLERIFEPFFTTKPVGSGSGLGLSMIEGFMKQSGGTVRVYSEPGVGTTFKLYFAATVTTPEVARSEPSTTMDSQHGTRATILLVEDNTDVLTVIRSALKKDGYRVLHASTGDQAEQLFERTPDIDLLLTDIVMPGELQGTTLARKLRGIRPDLPVIFMSGYASEATVHGNGLRPEDIRLMKPIRRDDLLRAVGKMLRQNAGPGPNT